MIIEPGSDDDTQKIPLLKQNSQWNSTEPSGSSFPPPPFAATDPNINEAAATELGPPPEFAPYQAEYFEQSNHDIVSHDPHLNSDGASSSTSLPTSSLTLLCIIGEALYRFLLSQSQTRPSYRIQCRGTHDELLSRWVTERDSQGHSRSRRETHTETVVDFDFCIDVHPEVAGGLGPIPWTVSENEPAYRGKMVREYEGFSSPLLSVAPAKHKPTRKERKQGQEWAKRRFLSGLPPWILQQDIEDGSVDILGSSQTDGLKSSKTVRQWADEYCASSKYLKEFVYEKVFLIYYTVVIPH